MPADTQPTLGLAAAALAAMPLGGPCDAPVGVMYLTARGEQPADSRKHTHALLRFRCDRRAWVRLPMLDLVPQKGAAWELWCPHCCPDKGNPDGLALLKFEEPGAWGPYTMLPGRHANG